MAWGERVRELADRLHPAGLLYSTYEQRLFAELDRERLPGHVAVLADGNRRWARLNAPGGPLVAGYQAGANKLKAFVGWCDEVGIQVVTLWVLSTENLYPQPRRRRTPARRHREALRRPGGHRALAGQVRGGRCIAAARRSRRPCAGVGLQRDNAGHAGQRRHRLWRSLWSCATPSASSC
jgi:hypothetical protein